MSNYLTHPDWLALVRAVVTTPTDDLPRLVAADWLDEHGEIERAEFIRVQVELAKMPGEYPPHECGRVSPHFYEYGDDDCRTCQRLKLAARNVQLHDSHADVWFRPPSGFSSTLLPPEKSVGGECFFISRGFVAGVRCQLEQWSECGPAIVNVQPVEVVEVTDRGPTEIGASWTWIHSATPATPDPYEYHAIPLGLWECDLISSGVDQDGRSAHQFPSRELANSALSETLIAWALAQVDPTT